MSTLYVVTKTAEGWAVTEDGLPIVAYEAKLEAVEVAHLLTVAARAAGGGSKMLVQDGDGRLWPWNLDRAARNFDHALATHGPPSEMSAWA